MVIVEKPTVYRLAKSVNSDKGLTSDGHTYKTIFQSSIKMIKSLNINGLIESKKQSDIHIRHESVLQTE